MEKKCYRMVAIDIQLRWDILDEVQKGVAAAVKAMERDYQGRVEFTHVHDIISDITDGVMRVMEEHSDEIQLLRTGGTQPETPQ